ncbi:putative sterile alpha motif domain-containing protein [Helianthus annuus]|uniref:Putative sterile alpha motif (SAM) domain-containing protein n=1 Tax=Helianthus annuus TaxID=4232 RepID=A0A251VDT6_HELAN|nr:uncharacterized protein LOC110911043 [Helianthus annuus]KAF5817147.1 putative sterile alpha motif domain-containing protein [Helianthus annuus]KAJ0603619.1 putative sterile alpha motif domain-containing protein [Helianthus annuus]KAJ0613793.1 putative sterile alpha motif domain-containing protein [Helianthus annuus]KAJ0617582.1 putative sterile alpha motif domain-containing protein [Helianthus annuus]KAJ0938522.1 putative sterile alpha motif domain-containing protein [Helianthus annuus]
MAELQPPSEVQLNGVNGGGGVAADPATVPAEPVAGPPKRQRRPSVRLGEIGDQHTYDNHRRTKPQQWKYSSKDSKATKTRQLMNLSGAAAGLEFHETLTLDPGIEDKDAGKPGNNIIHNHNNINHHSNHNNNSNCGAIGGWKVGDLGKTKRGFSVSTKRVRSNWGVKMDDQDERFDDEDDFDDADRYSDYDRDGSGSQLKDQSLNLSMDYGNRDRDGVRVRDRDRDGVELDGPSDTDARNWNDGSLERNGVRVWLNQLGLGRYFSIFEVHEVDDEVLPLLTLEDLKDMGINAVGSRRKMFCSIQKLGKGFS